MDDQALGQFTLKKKRTWQSSISFILESLNQTKKKNKLAYSFALKELCVDAALCTTTLN